jgi:predicted transcriptional regulator
MSAIRENPSNQHHLSKAIGVDYKTISHHVKVLEKNNLISKIGEKYGTLYFGSALFEENQNTFHEILSKLPKSTWT